MARQALATIYRPHTFEDVGAQEHIKIILQEQLAAATFKHVYLFCGASGCGKTTIARIMADAINKGQGKPIEVDAASNSGVDNVRGIIDDSKKKSLDSEYKVYIIDECHMLSVAAWNALLKLVEEPPKFTVYIFCTTNPEKIPETILNRVQRFDFTKIPNDIILNRLNYICKEEGINAEDDALQFIAKASGGGMRTAISYLDKRASLNNNITTQSAVTALGIADYDLLFELLQALDKKDVNNAIRLIEQVYNNGVELKLFLKDYLNFLVDVCKYKLFKNFTYIRIPKLPQYEQILTTVNINNCYDALDVFKDLVSITRYESNPLYTIEGVLISEYGRAEK